MSQRKHGLPRTSETVHGDFVMNETILRLPQVIALIGLSRSTLYHQIALGAFPRQIKIGERAVGWRASDIAAWVDQLEAKQSKKKEEL